MTAGAHADGIVGLIADVLRENGVPDGGIFTTRRSLDLPLYFRPARSWDLVVVHEGKLIACLEFKSHVGPSFGNNYNNRAQEAVGDGHDMNLAFREGLFEPSPKPWIGYILLLEDATESRQPVRVPNKHFSCDAEFVGASYAGRYEVTIQRLVREALYDAASFMLATRDVPSTVTEPNRELTFRRMVTSLIGHAIGVLAE